MGANTSKKTSTAPSKSAPTEPRLPDWRSRLLPSQHHNNNFRPVSIAPYADKPYVNNLLQSNNQWNQEYNKYKSSQNDDFLARISQRADGIRKTHELDKVTFDLRLKRSAIENELLTRPTAIPKPQTSYSFRPIIPRLQSHKENDAKYFSLKKKRPELTDDMVRHIQLMISAPPNQLLTEIDGVQILGKDIRTLIGLNWLNDEIINAYMTLLVYRGAKAGNHKVHAFNTFFYPKLREAGYNSVRRWTRKVDIFNFEYIVVPVHLGNHWTLVFIDFKKRTISYYDSLAGYSDGYCDILLDYLRSEMSDKKKQEFSDSGWQLLNRSNDGIPLQNNCSDCGVFACIYAEHLTRQADLDFSQEDMPYFRKRMIYEITKQTILE